MPAPKLRPISCPASYLGRFHMAAYDLGTGVWKCQSCGLAGNQSGLDKLHQLEAELYRLDGEISIARFEIDLANQGRRRDLKQQGSEVAP